MPLPSGPVFFTAPDDYKQSPVKGHKNHNFDPRKHDPEIIPAKASLDRPLQVQSSMGTTVLVDFDTFMKDILPALPTGRNAPKTTKITSTEQKKAHTDFFRLFNENVDEGKKTERQKEDTIAEGVVKIINEIGLPNGYKARLSRYKADKSDDTRSKVDAALYAEGHAPSDQRPDWTHCRLFMEFKAAGTEHDPWDDRAGASPESEANSRSDVRAQLIAYAYNTFLYQHRAALYSLFFIGKEFRVARWDRSGVIVSRKVDYVAKSEKLVQFLWRFVQLDDVRQGFDPTVTMIEEGDEAYKLMDKLALPDPEVDVDYMDFRYSHPTPPGAGTSEDSTAASKDTRPRQPSTASNTSGQPSKPAANTAGPSGAPSNSKGPHLGRTRSASRAAALQQSDPDLRVVPEEIPDDIRVFTYVRDKFRDSLVPGFPRYKLRVGNDDRIFLVGKPLFSSSSMFGHATRGYVAVDACTRQFVFLKDSWRPFYEGVEPEGVYLAMFANEPEMIVPEVLRHGDVANQRAYTAIYEEKLRQKVRDEERRLARVQAKAAAAPAKAAATKRSGSKKRAREEADVGGREPQAGGAPALKAIEGEASLAPTLRHHIHYRIVVKDVCLPFDCFRSTYQLIELMFECVKTHEQAYTKHGLLHRDISAGNVLILPRHQVTADKKEKVVWHGVLTDWELAKRVPKDGEDKARQPERTGTMQFMSLASMASGWTLPIVVADKLESFFHVMLFYAVRYIPHTIEDVATFVVQYFDTFIQQPDGTHSSVLKEAVMAVGRLKYSGNLIHFLKRNRKMENPLNKLIQKLLELMCARYQVIAYEVERRRVAEVQAKPASSSTVQDDYPETWGLTDKYAALAQADEQQLAPVTADELPPTVVATATLLDTHERVLSILMSTLRIREKALWADTGVVEKDQLANSGYEPRGPRVQKAARSTTGFATDGSKRAKTETSQSVAALDVRAETDSQVLALALTWKEKGRA